jgi:predicted NBD/HSP70 family sugar kinase
MIDELKQKIYTGIVASEPVSRIQLAEKYGYRLATVTERTRELLDQGLIIEAGEDRSSGGRRPILLKTNPDAFFILGLRIVCNEISMGLYNSKLNLLGTRQVPVDIELNNENLITELRNAVEMMQSAHPEKKVSGIGIAFPGRVDCENGKFMFSGILPGVEYVPVKSKLEKLLNIPVWLEHDVTAAAMAEYYLGHGHDISNLGVIMINDGIGSRFVIDGKPLRGANNGAGEFGHLSLDTHGPKCYCGNNGCFEQLAGIAAIEKIGKDSFGNLLKRAHNKDATALEVFARTGRHIGEAILNILHFLDCEMIILNGKITQAAEFIEPSMHEKLNSGKIFRFADSGCKVEFSSLGNEVVHLGPALTATAEIFDKSYSLDLFAAGEILSK